LFIGGFCAFNGSIKIFSINEISNFIFSAKHLTLSYDPSTPLPYLTLSTQFRLAEMPDRENIFVK